MCTLFLRMRHKPSSTNDVILPHEENQMQATPQEQALESMHSLGRNFSWVPVMHAEAQPGTLPGIWHHQSAQSARDAVSSCQIRPSAVVVSYHVLSDDHHVMPVPVCGQCRAG